MLTEALQFHLWHKFNLDFGKNITLRMIVVGLIAVERYHICDLISFDNFNNMTDDDVDMVAKEVKAFLKSYNVTMVSDEPSEHQSSNINIKMILTLKSGHYSGRIHYTTDKRKIVDRYSLHLYTDEPDCGTTGVHLTGHGFVLEKPVDKIKQPLI